MISGLVLRAVAATVQELALYIGMLLDQRFGETATLVCQQDEDPSEIRFMVGLRM